ncbi:MAG: hypothetical protein MJ207_03780 [Bacilli bacterium]|nr:hypothetical protein [Bacilli bacterium]
MAKRIIFMGSMLLTTIAILLMSDLLGVQMIYDQLDNVAMTVGYYISKDGGITKDIQTYVKKEINAVIYTTLPEGTVVKVGDTYPYVIDKEYLPIVLGKNKNHISVERSVVIGLFA